MTSISDNTIPKIIHQLWIGDQSIRPWKLMETWKNMNPDFEYISWNENEIKDRKLEYGECRKRINEMKEINGKADIIRWLILYEYGGYFFDADSICMSPIDDHLINVKCFAGYEHEQARPGLIATGSMGFPPKHPLVKHCIDWIIANCVDITKCGNLAWVTCGPKRLTEAYNTGLFKDLTIFPSYYFLPVHCTGAAYKGHGKVYAYQEWGSTKQSYKTMNDHNLPIFLKPPTISASVLVSNYNTKAIHIKECLESIKRQEGMFNIELVWINDGSTEINTSVAKKLLEKFITETRNTTLSYHENEGNKGIGYSLNKGIKLCSNEIILRMDADDIMIDDRMMKQISVMISNPQIKIIGGQVQCFNEMGNLSVTSHQTITWEQYKINPSHWFLNHPSVCFLKSAVLEAGNYNPDISRMSEDFDLWLRMMKMYGVVYNMPDTVLKYRIHDSQVTHNGGIEGQKFWSEKRMEIINNLINN